jgi:outer membrane protein TolC
MKTNILSLQKRMLIIAMLSSISLPALATTAAPKPKPKPVAHHHVSGNNGSVIHINPVTLRRDILSENTDVLKALNTAYQAKAAVNIAHGNLLPSINASAVISGIATGGASFAVSSVSILLPFLLPSNWYNLDATKSQLSASGYAYYIVELNTYANALAAYQTVQYDMALRNIYYEEYQRYLLIQNYVQIAFNIGKDIGADLERAEASTQLARGTVDNYDSAIAKEVAILRQLISRNLNAQVIVDSYHPPVSSYESRGLQSILNAVFPKSPEEQQVLSLIQASKYQTLSQAFSFLGGASLNATPSAGFGSTSFQANGSLGFGYFANIDAKNLVTDQLYAQQKAVRLQEAATIESSVNSIQADISGVAQVTASRDNVEAAFQAFLGQYSLGKTDLTTLIDVELQLTTSELQLAALQNDLDNQRIDLERITISNQFGKVPSCRLTGNESTGFLSFFTDLFNPKSNVISIDKLCGVSPATSVEAAPSQATLLPE